MGVVFGQVLTPILKMLLPFFAEHPFILVPIVLFALLIAPLFYILRKHL